MVPLCLSMILASIWVATAVFICMRSMHVSGLSDSCDSIISHGGLKTEWKPFIRMNNKQSPRPTKLSLFSRSFAVGPLKFWGSLTLVGICSVSSLFIKPAAVASVSRWVSSSILKILGIKVVQKGKRAPCKSAPLLISNHVAPTDILALLSLECCFVAKDGVRRVPGVGRVAASIGCIFVGRDSADSRSAAKEAISVLVKKKMTDSSLDKNPLVIFPEGTTTNGFGLIEFRRGGFEAGVPIQPVRLEYNNLQYSMAMLDALEHLCYMCALPGCKLQVTYLPVIRPRATDTAEMLAKQSRDAIMEGTNLESYGLETHRHEIELLSFIKGEKMRERIQQTLQMKKST